MARREMARLGLAAGSRSEFEATRPEYPLRYRSESAQPQRPTVPSRIGAGSRPRRNAKRSDGLMLWRVLGISAATLILGMGGLLAYNLVTPPAPAGAAKPVQATAATQSPPASSQAPLPTPAALAPSATAKLTQSTPPRRIAEAGHGQSALKVASLLGGGGETAAMPIPEVGPTPADFSRPAFLEPLDDADAVDTAAKSEAVPETKPAAEAAPLPAPRPVKMASADAAASDADAAETARIRSAVTMRSGPRRSASPIGTLEAGTKVKLYSCKSWCEVSSGDKRGWVYKSSVDR